MELGQTVYPQAALQSPRAFGATQLTTTAASFAAQIDSSIDYHIHTLMAVNTSGSAETLTLYLVPSGGSAATATIVYKGSIPANSTYFVLSRDVSLMLSSGAQLYADADTDNVVNVSGWGYDYRGNYG